MMPPLEMSADEFRALAEGVTALATGFLARLDDRPTVSATSATDTAAFDVALPEEGLGEAVLHDLEGIAGHVRSPTGRRVAYVVGSGDPVVPLTASL